MTFCEVAIVGSPQDVLTYHSDSEVVCGTCVDVPLQRRTAKGVVVSIVEKPPFKTRSLEVSNDGFISSEHLSLAKFIASYYVCSLGEALSSFHPFSSEKPPFNTMLSLEDVHLSPSQFEAFEEIQTHDASLLFGVTGSGKTEVYIKLMQEMVAKEKRTILLMPEIGLTPQMEKRIERYFGKRVALWHSKQTKKTKDQILERIKNGEVDIVAGARSALFLPLYDVGLIIVDEEHDDSYKSASKPRLNARDCALVLGRSLGAKVVLGSATPSVTSWHKLPVVKLDQTFYPSSKKIEFVRGDDGLDETILRKIGQTLEEKKQVLVFVPTRANFKILRCGVCGVSVQCPFCSVSMSLHRKHKALECHYCHYRCEIPESCPSCQGGHLTQFRIGTQEVVLKLSEAFGEAIIGRFDRDEVTTEAKLRTLLSDFNAHKIDILVGTQMLSKGHDYHDIGLAVILGIDFIFSIPDYKAREKAMQLLVQIAGRTGRKGEGRVVIQSANENFFAPYIDNYLSFLNDELAMREEMYPPYVKMATILVTHLNEQKGDELLKVIAKHLKTFEEIEVVGEGAAAIEKIANTFRFMILVRSKSAGALMRALHSLESSPHIAIDMDPVTLL